MRWGWWGANLRTARKMAWLEQRELGKAEDEFRKGLGQTSKKLMTLALFLCDMGRMEGVELRKHDLTADLL